VEVSVFWIVSSFLRAAAETKRKTIVRITRIPPRIKKTKTQQPPYGFQDARPIAYAKRTQRTRAWCGFWDKRAFIR
jgi:hypothetical protein